jgi:fumarate hydratase subunit beta
MDGAMRRTALPEAVVLKAPYDADAVRGLRAGDTVRLSGPVLTARDAAHRRLQEDLDAGKALPVDLKGQFVFYAGPAPAKPGRIMGSIAATTSGRMDAYVKMALELGILGTIGKGERSPFVAELCRGFGAVYFLSTGGAAALISNHVKNAENIAYTELGPESIKRLEFDGLSLIVGIDSNGGVFQPGQIARYRR